MPKNINDQWKELLQSIEQYGESVAVDTTHTDLLFKVKLIQELQQISKTLEYKLYPRSR